MTKIETFYTSKLLEAGFEEIPSNGSYSPIGKLFQPSKECGEGFYWIYAQKELYNIKIHDFSFHKDTILDIKPMEWLECLNITYCESISGEEIMPYRNMTGGCITTFFGGEQSYKAVVRKNVPVRCIGIEILPYYYDKFLKETYGNEYVNPREALRSIDPTVQFPEMVSLMRQIWNYRGDGMPAQLFYESKIAEAISLIVTYNQQHTLQKTKVISSQDKELIAKAAFYISDHFNSEISLEQLSYIACMGATKLKSCFKQIYGCTITEYIKQQRIEHAKSLLTSSDFSIEQIAKTVGYSNAGRFAGDFRNSAGVLPVEFRKNTKK